jgi:hypothetical protein
MTASFFTYPLQFITHYHPSITINATGKAALNNQSIGYMQRYMRFGMAQGILEGTS